jgi:hypothetical protein
MTARSHRRSQRTTTASVALVTALGLSSSAGAQEEPAAPAGSVPGTTAQQPQTPPAAPPAPAAAPPEAALRVYPPPPTLYSSPVRPRELDWEDGQPIPEGYRVEGRIRKGLVIAGAATFGAAYILTALGAAIAIDNSEDGEPYEPLFIPVAGPFVTIRTADASATATFGLVVDGVVQVGGLAMLIAGLAAQEQVLVRVGDAELTPVVGDRMGGLGLGGSF